MSRIAVVIGVSEYTRQKPLPACQNDAEIVRYILEKSNAYEDILCLTGSATNSDDVKFSLTQFVERHKGRTDLEEVFFYYSGHGAFIDDDFFYVLSDFEDGRRNRTALKNAELDGYLRTLSPNVAVKIVDACNAGVQYVKDIGGLSEIIEKGSRDQGLNKVYFLFSSLLDQSSFATSEISHYTRCLVEAIYGFRRSQIRYRDIVDQIADSFQNNSDQRPFFVIQADNTELFGVFDEPAKTSIKGKFESILSKEKVSALLPNKQPTLADLIKEQAKDYLNEDEILEAIQQLLFAARKFSLPMDVRELFGISVTSAKNLHGAKNVAEIGKWLSDNKKEYLARPITKVEEYDGWENKLVAIMATANPTSAPPMKRLTRAVVSGYELMWDALPFWHISINLESDLPNVPRFKLNIAYVLSRLDVRVFYSIEEGSASSGGFERDIQQGPWKAIQLRLRELRENIEVLAPIFSDFSEQIIEKLRTIVGVKDEPAPEVIQATEEVGD